MAESEQAAFRLPKIGLRSHETLKREKNDKYKKEKFILSEPWQSTYL